MMPNIAKTPSGQTLKEVHQAPRTEVISRSHSWILTRSSYNKDRQQDRYSMHFYSNSRALEGITVDNVAQQLGFSGYAPCQFVHNSERLCLSREIDNIIDVAAFSEAFENAYRMLKHTEAELQVCGIDLHLGEAAEANFVGDGHHVTQINRWLEEKNRDYEAVVLRVEIRGLAGWITHYQFANDSNERSAALLLLGLRYCESCGQFDFEPCHWRFTQQKEYSRLDHISSHGVIFQQQFRAQQMYLARSVDNLISAHHLLEPFGVSLLSPSVEVEETPKHEPAIGETKGEYQYDVAISFAGADRMLAAELNRLVRDAGYTVFYDANEDLWGRDLGVYLAEVYAAKALFCVVFVSPEYANGKWTTHEFNNALARAMEQRVEPYLLPVIIRDAKVPGLRSTIAHERISEKNTIQDIAKRLIRKVADSKPSRL